MKLCVFDIEADGLKPSRIHCLSAAIYSEGEWRIKSTTDYSKMVSFFDSCDVLVGHNIARWDLPHIKRLLNIEIKAKVVDTLALSWYLYPNRNKHGLEAYGEELGILKPKIDDWENLSIEEYINRCEEDVKINCKLWDKQWKDLTNLYDSDDKAWKFLNYLEFKMDCAAEAERSRWKLDVEGAEKLLDRLEKEKEDKISELTKVMPKQPKTTTIKYPNKLYKKDGGLSVIGVRWFEVLAKEGLPSSRKEDVTYVVGYSTPNPSSVSQVKDWLYSLGWIPETFKDVGDRKVEQIRKDIGGEKVLCKSVKKLFDVEPKLELLEGLSVLTHRIGIVKGFLSNVDDEGYVRAEIQGLTNTLRFKHAVVVNLPSVNKPFGEEIRGLLTAPDGYELCGSDMASLEDRTKQHYMWDYDPDYVNEMLSEGFDPHLDLAVFAGFITKEQAEAHKTGDENHSKERSKAKTANYACLYGAAGATVAKSAEIPKSEGMKLVEKYWERNWSVKEIANNQTVKVCLGGMWLFNPISKFWYSLRYEKDIFSTLNQGTGVYCFDVWIKNFRKSRPQLTGQMHDEIILTVKKGEREQIKELLTNAIIQTNKMLKLNRDLDIDIKFGDNYAQIH